MFNAETNEIFFPHIVPGNVLGIKTHVWNSINSGIFPIGKHNLIRNKFFGGNVSHLGLIGEYGFYACPHYLTKTIVGFFIDDPSTITELGKKLLKEKYPTATIVWEKVTSSPHRELTTQELQAKKDMISKAVENGASAAEVTMATSEELEGLLKAQNSGKSNVQVTIEDSGATKDKVPVVVKHLGSKR